MKSLRTWHIIAMLAFTALPTTAAAQATVPVVVRITELVQLNHGQDPGALGIGQSLGDFYAEVSINGTTQNNRNERCDNPPATLPANEVFDVPYVMFSFADPQHPIIDPSCQNVPWTFTVDVPLSTLTFNETGIDVVIRIKDADSDFPGDDDDEPATVSLKVPFGARWRGTVNWPENCNREAVAGSGARVCWEIETGKDSDGDGLLDDWEINGLDLGNGLFLNLPAMGANPMHKDLFLELDWRPDSPPQRAEIQKVKEAFAAAPIDTGGVRNPDGLPGITLHIDTGNLRENGLLVGDDLGGGNALAPQFPACAFNDNLFQAAKAANFDSARRGLVFRYGITSTQCCTFGPNLGMPCLINEQCSPGLCQDSGGQAEIGGNDLIVWNTQFQGSTLMHELGHTLNLEHGGNSSDNCKPNYLSVMNYDHFEIQRLDGSRIIDYSPPRQPNGTRGTAPLDSLIENNLSESSVLDPADPQSFLVYTNAAGRKMQSLVGAPVDWNGDGLPTPGAVAVNIDTSDAVTGRPELCENTDIDTSAHPLTGFDDWLNVSLPFQQFAESAQGPVNPVMTREPTDAEILSHRRTLNTTDLSLSSSGPAGPYEAGTQVSLSYSLDVSNRGPNPALPARLQDTLPPGAALVGADPRCAQTSAGQVSCDFPGLLSGATTTASIAVLATASCQNGVPTPIVNRARVDNAAQPAGPDPQPANNAATVSTTVVDTTAPTLTLSATPSQLSPPNHQFVPVTVSVTSTDVCDGQPSIRLVSITSNEGTNAPGSGNTSPDVRGAAFGTDDRQFELRAERSGGGNGRIYTITYEAQDHSGNKTTSTVTVTVPKSQGNP